MTRPVLAAALVLLAVPAGTAAQTVCGTPNARPPAARSAVLESTTGFKQQAQEQSPDPAIQCGPSDPLPNLAATSSMVASGLNFDFGVDPYSLVSTSVRFSEDATKQKLSISPLKLRTDPTAWNDWTLGLVTGGSTTTFSTGLTYDQASQYASRRKQVIDDFNSSPDLAEFRRTDPQRQPTDTLQAYEQRVAAGLARVYSRYWMERFRNTNSLTATGSVQAFGSTVASKVDLDNDGKIDNAYALKSYAGSVQWLHRWDFWAASTLTLSAARRRTSSVEGTPMRNTYGASLSTSRVLFLLDRNYLASKEYRSKLYVPSVSGGASVEWQECRGTSLECEDRLVRRWTLMPYLDTRLPGGAQFRIGIPVRWDRVGDKTGARIEPLLQFGWSLASF